MQHRLAIVLTVLAALAAGCTRKTSDRDVVFLKPADALAKSTEAPGLFGSPTRSVWVDPRQPEHYAAEHIEGAISLPFPRMSAEAPVVLRGYNHFFVYGTSFDDTIAKAASKRLMELGFDDVYTIEGGLAAWKRDGYAVVAMPAAAPAKPAAPAPGATVPANAPTAAPAPKPANTPAPAPAPGKVAPASAPAPAPQGTTSPASTPSKTP